MAKKLTIQQRVTNGAIWLDRNHPTWVDMIDVKRLDMLDCTSCILGQLYGNYFDIVDDFWGYGLMTERTAVSRGFNVPEELKEEGQDPRASIYYDNLNRLWEQEIAKRRGVSV